MYVHRTRRHIYIQIYHIYTDIFNTLRSNSVYECVIATFKIHNESKTEKNQPYWKWLLSISVFVSQLSPIFSFCLHIFSRLMRLVIELRNFSVLLIEYLNWLCFICSQSLQSKHVQKNFIEKLYTSLFYFRKNLLLTFLLLSHLFTKLFIFHSLYLHLLMLLNLKHLWLMIIPYTRTKKNKN